MSILMENKDYLPNAAGSVAGVVGDQALLNEILFRLSVRRGSFPMQPQLGSDLWRLRWEKPSARASLARQYAVQALEDLTQVTVTGAQVTAREEILAVRIELDRQGEHLSVELEE